jgi:hypothetical protein
LEAQIEEKETAVSLAVEVEDYDTAEKMENERQSLLVQLAELQQKE